MASVSNTDGTAFSTSAQAFEFVAANGTELTIGANGGDDTLYLAINSRCTTTGRTFSSVTIDGVGATQDVQSIEPNDLSAIYRLARNLLPDPDQVDVDVIVTFSGAMDRGCAAGIYVTADAVEASPAATNNVEVTTPSVDPTSLTLDVNVPVGSFLIGIGGYGSAPTVSSSWVGLTSDASGLIGSVSYFHSARASNVSAATPRTVAFVVDDSSNNPANYGGISACVAVYQPAIVSGFQAAWARGSNVMIGGG